MDDKKTSIIFLGTGTSQGVPPIGCKHPVCLSENQKDKRLRSSALIQANNKNYLIDCGPDFRQQMIRENISDVESIFFTHEHNDHVSGLDDIRPLYYARNGENIPLYCPKPVEKSIRERFAYFFKEKRYPGVPEVDILPVNGSDIVLDELIFEPIEIMHGKQSIFGYKIGGLVYITDASEIPENSIEKIKNCDVLVLNALRKAPLHYSHFILSQAIDMVRIIKPNKAYLTHISHLLGFHDEVEKELPKNIHLAYDGLKVNFKL